MKAPHVALSRLKIDGFGHFGELTLRFSPGLNLLHGQNEAGKSTLLAFLRAILFGFSRKGPGRYEVGNAAAFGGELELDTPQGPLWVRRDRSKRQEGQLLLRTAEGAQASPERLAGALGGVGRQLFEQVFAFDLDALRDFAQLTDDASISEALAVAGLQGASGLPRARLALSNRAAELYLPRGRKQLNVVLEQLEDTRAQLAALGDLPARWAQAQLQEKALEQALQGLQAERLAAREALGQLDRLSRAAPHLAEAALAEQALVPAPAGSFPSNAVERLELLEAEQGRAATEAARREAHAAVHGQALARLERALQQREGAADAQAALKACARVEAMATALPGRSASLTARRAQLAQQQVALVGDGPARPLSAAARAALQREVEQLALAAAALSLAQSQAQSALAREAEAAREVRALTERLQAVGAPTPEGAAGDAASLQRALLAAQGLPALERELERAAHDAQQASARHQALAALPPEPKVGSVLPGWAVAVALVMGLCGLLALPVPLRAGGGAALAGLSALLLGAFGTLRARAAAQEAARGQRASQRLTELGQLSIDAQRQQARTAALRAQWAAQREEAAVEGAHDAAARSEALGAALQQLQARLVLEREHAGARAREQSSRAEREGAQQRLVQAQQALAQARSALDGALARAGLPEGLSGAAALELSAQLAQLLSRQQALAEDEAALAADAQAVAQANALLVRVASQLGLTREDAPAPPDELAGALESWLEKGRALAAEAAALRSEVPTLDAALAAARQGLRQASAALGELLGAAQVDNAFDFKAQARAALEAAAARERYARALEAAQAVTALPLEEARARAAQVGDLAAALGAATARAEALELRLEQVQRALGEAATVARQLETDGQVAALRAHEEALLAQAQGLGAAWARARLGLLLLEEARERFEREQQPAVVRLAEATFTLLTGGRYLRVFLEHGADKALRVVDKAGRALSPEQLSRGTREQLFLAFRLAVAEDFGRRNVALPLILDDVLVNFDPGRAERAVEALVRLATRHQVIALTCQPSVRELFARAGARLTEVSGKSQLTLEMP